MRGLAFLARYLGASGWALEPQGGNLKFAIRVFQLNLPSVCRYSVVYQKVQSSMGSTAMLL